MGKKSNNIICTMTYTSPIFLIFLYILYPNHFRVISHDPLGKLLSICLIILFSHHDIVHGIVACLLVIVYYHIDTENFVSLSTQNQVDFLPKPGSKSVHGGPMEPHIEKDFTSVDEAYGKPMESIQKEGEALFRKHKCNKSTGKVEYKDLHVKNNYVSHVYSELDFDEEPCNPCDETCHFRIQEKQTVEDTLQTPKSSNENVLWDMVTALTSSESEPVVMFSNKDMTVASSIVGTTA